MILSLYRNIYLVCVVVLLSNMCRGGTLSFAQKVFRKRTVLPKLLPHKDDRFLIEFVADNSDACQQMGPVVQRLEKDFNILVRRVNISRRPEFAALYEACGGNEGNNLPFYYNRRTGQAVAGPTPYWNLKLLASGDVCHSFIEPPSLLDSSDSIDMDHRRGVGVFDIFNERFSKKIHKMEDL